MPQPRKYKTTPSAKPPTGGAMLAKAVSLDGLLQGLRALRKEITRRRAVARAKRKAKQWNPDTINTLELTELINYVENELDRLMTGRTGPKRNAGTITPIPLRFPTRRCRRPQVSHPGRSHFGAGTISGTVRGFDCRLYAVTD